MANADDKKYLLFWLLGGLLLIAFLVLFNVIWADISDLISKAFPQGVELAKGQKASLELRQLIAHFISIYFQGGGNYV